jgi:periplasmic protein TonB
MKRTTLILIAVLAMSQLCRAQAYKNEKLIYLDASGKRTKEKSAVVLEQVVKLDDTLWEINLYQAGGPRLRTMRCGDPDGNTLNGQSVYYNATGERDTIGSYFRNKRVGHWTVYTPKGRVLTQQLYEDGQLVWTRDTLQLQHESDSLNAMHKTDSSRTFTKVEIESSFPGGVAGWGKYLQKNLRYPDFAVKNKIQGQVIVGFVVDKEGHIPFNDVWVDRSVEYSVDQEALRIVFTSPEWIPAVQNGRKVKSYKKQPVVFKLQ